MADVRMEKVVKRYGEAEVIHGVDLQIDDGEFAVFVGPSGCGKSTLLRMISGLEEISDGDLFIGGEQVNDVPPAKRGIAMVFQSYALYPHLTARGNLEFGLRLQGAPKSDRDRRVQNAADILQITELLDRRPKDMSGGQRQRVAIGRAIVRDPSVFLFDEPLSNLDAKLRVQMRQELAELHGRLNTTMIYVTHDQVEAMTMADKIVVLQDGFVEQVGSPMDLYHRPRNRFVAGFIGSPGMNFLPATARGQGQATVELAGDVSFDVPLAEGMGAQGQVAIGIRPEHLKISGEKADAGTLRGEVSVIERLGAESYAYVRTEVGQVIVKADGDLPVKIDERIQIVIDPKRVHLFDNHDIVLTAGTA